jgi:hypothetical protein
MKNKSSQQLLAEQVEHLKNEIASIEGSLEIPVLDGNPYLLLATCYPDNGVEPYDAVLAQKGGKQGFQALSVQASHLCGCLLYSPERADENIEKLIAAQKASQKTDLGNFRPLHRRQFLVDRLAFNKQLLADFESHSALLNNGGAK